MMRGFVMHPIAHRIRNTQSLARTKFFKNWGSKSPERKVVFVMFSPGKKPGMLESLEELDMTRLKPRLQTS